VDEWPQQAGPAESVQVDAGLAQPTACTEHVADAEGAADQGVDVDAAGEDVASGRDEVDGVAGCGEFIEASAAMRVRS
jgi:hypothetical protein